MQGRVVSSQTPVMYSGMQGFQAMPSVETTDDSNPYDEAFQKSYTDLAHQIAYRYPNPGLPRIRQGAIGGTWRHIKEVLGHHGSRVCFVDGLVSVYDTDRFSEALQPSLPYQGKHVQPPFAPTQAEHAANGRRGVVLPSLETDVQRKVRIASSTPRHRGHYLFK
ncbi:zinc finger SWIM domain-containing protein 6 [Elysia marginata]|uniref:Zinc finger SWIM domain-containing protein 6 n=1 Tax=Elysia marginata TaxID=1093978 RepID=A0AAV4FL56_9GAST|nr:zinc finger SWIM domain-containing protein 6 [Elysia marginata]